MPSVTYRGNDRDPVFATYPLPWERGSEHETMCEIRDSHRKLVFRVAEFQDQGLGRPSLSDVMDVLLGVLNLPHVGHCRRGSGVEQTQRQDAPNPAIADAEH